MGTRCHIAATVAVLVVAGAFVWTAASCGDSTAPKQVTVTTTGVVAVEGGGIRGVREGSLRAYLGVPFAAPPVGGRRWRPPQPVLPWAGVRDCSRCAPACPQQLVPGLGVTRPGPQSEDCLYLNVWTSARGPSERRPVMVWIHGGGFVCGSADVGPAAAASLCARGVVLVSISYRLGIFGYFALPRLSRESPHHVSGNYGLLDQVAALKWVRRNIAAFGGDPRRVTIFGESAGGQSVISLLVSPLSRGLFARAICESPRYEDEGVGTWATRPLRVQESHGVALARSLGVAPGPGQLAALRRVSSSRLLLAARPAPRPTAAIFSQPPSPSFQPVIDGYALPREPWQMLAARDWAHVPVMVGSNRDEANMWYQIIPASAAPRASLDCWRQVAWYTGRLFRPLVGQFPAARLGGFVSATSRMMTVLEFNSPARYTAQCIARSGYPAYLYYFAWAPPGDPWGAVHGAELPYVFGLRADASGPASATERTLTAQVQSYWTEFATAGDPNGPGRPRWPSFSGRGGRLLVFGATAGAAPVPYEAACVIVDRVNHLR